MSTLDSSQSCPLCGSGERMGGKAKPLYGHLVCKKCYYGFANRRQLAWAIDVILWLLVISPIAFVIQGATVSSVPLVANLGAVGALAVRLTVLFKDGFKGYSPVKALLGVRVIDATAGSPAGFWASFKRNLPLVIPVVPVIVGFQLCQGYRWGDGWANTRVIWWKHRDKAPFKIGGERQDVQPPQRLSPLMIALVILFAVLVLFAIFAVVWTLFTRPA